MPANVFTRTHRRFVNLYKPFLNKRSQVAMQPGARSVPRDAHCTPTLPSFASLRGRQAPDAHCLARAGVSAQDLLAAEAKLGVKLPWEVRATRLREAVGPHHTASVGATRQCST